MKLPYRIAIILLFFSILVAVIAAARGYRIDVAKKAVTSTGILAVSSWPKAAKVYVNQALKGATDINITLPPGAYNIEVKKEGYTSWKKTVSLKGELVLALDATLYPLNPSLTPLSNLGITKSIPITGNDKVILVSQKDAPETDGIYLFEPSRNMFSFFPPLKTIVLKKHLPQDSQNLDLNSLEIEVSPDFKQAVLFFKNYYRSTSFLVNLEKENTDLFDISSSSKTLITAWQSQKLEFQTKILEAYPKDISKIATQSFDIIAFSPDENKLLYRPTVQTDIPQVIKPPLIASNQTPEERNVTPTSLYIYDKKEDKNYKIMDNNQLVMVNWYSDSRHLVINDKKKLSIIDYDGTNTQSIYSGPYDNTFFSVTTDGRIIILTNLNPQVNTYGDLYTVGIK